MERFVDSVSVSLKQTLNWPLFIYFFAVQVLEIIAVGLVMLFFVLVGMISFFGLVGRADFSQLGAFFLNPSNVLLLAAVAIALFALFFLVVIYISAFFLGLRFNLFNNFLKTKALDLGKAFGQSAKRAFTYFKIDLIVTVLVFLIVTLLMLLILMPMLRYFPGELPLSAVGPVVAGAALALALGLLFLIAVFFLMPVLSLFAPVAFFEDLGAMDSIRRSFALAKADYFGNLAFVILYGLIVIGVGFIISLILRTVSTALFLPFFFAGATPDPSVVASMLGGIAMFAVIYLVISIPFSIWSSLFQTTCFRNLYALDVSLLEGGKPKRSASGARARKTK